MGSAMYKDGIRWTEGMEFFCGTHGRTDIIVHYMVLYNILTISMTIDHPYGFHDTYESILCFQKVS